MAKRSSRKQDVGLRVFLFLSFHSSPLLFCCVRVCAFFFFPKCLAVVVQFLSLFKMLLLPPPCRLLLAVGYTEG